MDRKTTFDLVPETYDTYRPRYPEGFVSRLLETTRMPNIGDILEVGCGTGQFTLPLAKGGHHVTCLDIGPNTVEFAKRKLAGFPNVAVHNSSFEDWQGGFGYDSIAAAQSWHWVDRSVGYRKAADLLKPGGSLILVWLHSPRPDDPLDRAIQRVYGEFGMAAEPDDPISKRAEKTAELLESGLFNEPTYIEDNFEAEYSPEGYIGLLNTYSDHLALPDDVKQRLMTGIRDAIVDHGGVIRKAYTAMGFVSRVR